MKKCWIIEQGEYSDYYVVGIFSTEDAAKIALAFIGEDSDATICERALDPGIGELNEGLSTFLVRFSGDCLNCVKWLFIDDEDMHWHDGAAYPVWAKDRDHAIKIAAEKHAAWQLQPQEPNT